MMLTPATVGLLMADAVLGTGLIYLPLALVLPLPVHNPHITFVSQARNQALRNHAAAHGGNYPIAQRRASLYEDPVLRITEDKSLSDLAKRTHLEVLFGKVKEEKRVASANKKRATRARKSVLEKS
jgi:hypothetical protein